MQILISIFHVVACLMLIVFILLQAGRGGGLSDMFGGGAQQQQKLFGTDTNKFMTKMTSICAVMFLITSIALGFITTQKSRSLVTPDALQPIFPTTGSEPLALPEEVRAEVQAAIDKAKESGTPEERQAALKAEKALSEAVTAVPTGEPAETQ